MTSIELAAPRVLVIEDRGKTFSLSVGRITRKQWLHYFEGILSTSENIDGKRVDSFDSSAARIELLESSLTSAEGYGELPEGWQAKLPLSHRLTASNLLIAAQAIDSEDDEKFVLGAEAVFLSAVWTADPEAPKMRRFTGLAHRFATPSAEHQRRFSREASRSRVVGGSRQGKTVWLGAQPTLIELYDELIQSVEGYTIHGRDLGSDRDAIAAEMDCYHKVVAADRLFSPARTILNEEGE